MAETSHVDGHPLKAPKNGKMSHIIYESNNAKGTFRLLENDEEILCLSSENISIERENL